MDIRLPRLKFRPQATHRLSEQDVARIVSHRTQNGIEQYLVQWKSHMSRCVYSWHILEELGRCLHFVQTYVENQSEERPHAPSASGALINRKRKNPGDDHITSRDSPLPALVGGSPNHLDSRLSSATSVNSELDDGSPMVYNGVLKRKEGRIMATLNDEMEAVPNSQTGLPTKAMVQIASQTPIVHAQQYIRQAFVEKLKRLRGVSLVNDLDASTPSLNFTFIDSYVLRDGVYAADPDSFEGCDKPCRPDMGQNIGCEYTRECGCLEYAAVDEEALKRQSPEVFARYQAILDRGEYPDTQGLPKRFPYLKPSRNHTGAPPTLQPHYRESRHPIYECNQNCNCGPRCKSRLVQKGRRVPLTIFKTAARGWGVFCNEDLLPGEFIDTYLGEVITNEEADHRENAAGREKASYLYSLDKFADTDDEDLTPESCFVVDGEYMGGPTRFINHSCEPNCRQYTVSYNKNDRRLYDLAFFAYDHIPAGTELTFDYMDKDEEEEEDVIKRREEAARDPNNLDKAPCLCGAKKCRGYLWSSG